MKKRLYSIIVIRVFAILTVVMGHSMIVFSNSWNYYQLRSSSQFFNYLKIFINMYQMPIFFFVSGFLFYYLKVELGKYGNRVSFLKNKFQRLVIPYLTVAILYMIPLRLLGKYPNYINENFFKIILKDILLGGDSGNLWFLPVLFLIFLFFRFIFFSKKLRFIREKNYLWIFIFLISANISVFMPNLLFMKNCMQYIGYFFLGYIFKNVLSSSDFIFSKWNLILTTILMLVSYFSQVFYIKNDLVYWKLLQFNISLIGSIASCIFIYVAVDAICKNKDIANNTLIKKLDRDSFGIYLFHSPLLYPILNEINGKYVNPYILVSSLFVFILMISWGITILLSSFKYTRFIVGK